jgi:aspartate/methionine/tyrosine aminotransferase
VITTTPCIDIMKLFLSERPDVVPLFVPSNRGGRFPYGLDEVGICDALDQACMDEPSSTNAVILTSPENPTGETWSRQSLTQIAERCADRGAVLIVDHCFLLAGVQQERPAAVWDEPQKGLEWIGIWDTGKTVGMNEEKLGFVIAGGSELPRFVQDTVNTIQFSVSRRQKLIISRILADARFSKLLEELRSVCKANVEFLASVLTGDPRLKLRVPSAGTMAMIDCSRLQSDDETIRAHLLLRDVGVISGRVFFHSDLVPTSLIRVALAREPSHFRLSVSRLVQVLKDLG